MSSRTLVLGYHTLGCLGFDALLRHGFDVAAVFTHRDNPKEEIWWESLAARAAARGIPVHTPRDSKDPSFAALIEGYRPDFIFSFYYRFMVPTRVLALAPRGAFNLHGSLLPRYRGAGPVQRALWDGCPGTGVTTMWMDEGIDTGAMTVPAIGSE